MIVLEHGPLRATVSLDPFELELRRGRRLISGLGLWGAAGESNDAFVQLTEGVIAAEQLEPPRRFRGRAAGERGAVVAAGALGRVRVELADERLTLDFRPAEGGPVPRRSRVGGPARRALHRPGRPPRRAARPDRAARAAGGRPALHRSRLPAGHA